MQNKKLEHWARQLLDTGKRNNLINFRETKSSSVEILLPGSDELFERACSGAEFEVLGITPDQWKDVLQEYRDRRSEQNAEGVLSSRPGDAVISSDDQENVPAEAGPAAAQAEDNLQNAPAEAGNVAAQAEDDLQNVPAEAGHVAAQAEDNLQNVPAEAGPVAAQVEDEREFYKRKFEKKMRKKKQILLYSSKGDPAAAVKNIEKRARDIIEETGVNVVYMAFGFVNWTDAGNSKVVFRAPLILIPIRIYRKSAVDPWLISSMDDELVINPTFDYLIRAEKGIGLPAYEEESLSEYLWKAEDLVSKLGWSVSADCRIGLFSFLKINMYHDLVSHEEEILANENVLTLLGEPLPENEDTDISDGSGQREEGENPLLALHTVIDADSSQMEAILMAKKGESFVLQGPPGTGKSQTITNIIAECLHDGKRVLFVSEKQAALNVVYDKLVKVGLGDFCLELHSYKANKKDVIAELVRTLNAEKTCVLTKAQEVIEAKADYIGRLDSYEAGLHTPLDNIHMSVYEMYNRLTALSDIEDTGYTVSDLPKRGSRHLQEAELLLEAYVKYIPEIGEDYRKHAWYGYIGRDGSAAAFDDFASKCSQVLRLYGELETQAEESYTRYGLSSSSFRDYTMNCNAMDLLGNSVTASPSLLSKERLSSVISVSEGLSHMSRDVIAARDSLLLEFTDRILELDGHEIRKTLLAHEGFFSRLFGSDYRQLTAALRECSRDGRRISYEKAVQYAEMLALYQDKKAAYDRMAAPAAEHLAYVYNGIDTDWKTVLNELYELKDGFEKGFPLQYYADAEPGSFGKEKAYMLRESANVRGVLGRLAAVFSGMQTLLDPKAVSLYAGSISGISTHLNRFLDGKDSFYNWSRFLRTLLPMQDADIVSFTDFVIDNGLPVQKLPELYEKTIYTGWVNYATFRCDALSDFTRATQDLAVREFARADRVQFEISRAQIRSELSAKRPSLDLIVPGSQVAILRREGEKKRRQKAIRTMLAETGDLIQLLKPCFLMSPLSISTFLGGSDIRFDTVVFDEASQVFPQDAIGAVYRGKQLIVVGDSKQMPPTNFFTSMVEAEGDEETGDVADFESILDICQASFPELSLKWHYRSRYESLIAFSNHSFYGDTLMTFPSVTRDRAGVGVDYSYVPDGIFDRKTHQNAAEAARVLDLIFDEIRMHPARSLGVVAFSISQQEMIDRMLNVRRMQDPSYEAFFSSEKDEPFFIKNLETVQGDERDTIIFSTAYGKDANGKLYHNFGPLNRVGGERRLNVAVTRAKENVILVSSMHFSDIDPAKSSAEGVIALRNYLQYAEFGQSAAIGAGGISYAAAGGSSRPASRTGYGPGVGKAVFNTRSVENSVYTGEQDAVCTSVLTFLAEKGLSADPHVGFGSAKVGIGVRGGEGGDYILAIETDGDLYHSLKNTRDRDRLRQEVLEKMGWNYYRLWSTEWMRNCAIEKERLLSACEDALKADDPDDDLTQVEEEPELEDFEYTGEEEELSFSIYRQADVVRLARSCGFFQEYIAEILKIEAPVSEEELLKRIVFVFGRDHVTQVVRRDYEGRMNGCERFGVERRDGFLYLAGEDAYVFRVPGVKRPVKYIALEELAAGMREILEENVSAERDGLYRKMAALLGYARVTDSMRERFDQAYELAAVRNV